MINEARRKVTLAEQSLGLSFYQERKPQEMSSSGEDGIPAEVEPTSLGRKYENKLRKGVTPSLPCLSKCGSGTISSEPTGILSEWHIPIPGE